MTDTEAFEWLRRRSCVILLHEERIIVAMPDQAVRCRVTDEEGFSISIPKSEKYGYVLAMSDPGDSLSDVVLAAQAEWRNHVSAVDALADANASWKHAPAKLDFHTDQPLFE